MKSLADILGDKWDEPPEIKLIKDYVRKNFQSDVGITMRTNQIIIATPNSALASALRMQLHELKAQLNTDKKLMIRIGR